MIKNQKQKQPIYRKSKSFFDFGVPYFNPITI